MYKVFIDNIPIYFQKDVISTNNIPNQYLPSLSTLDFKKFKEELKHTDKSIYYFINSPNPLLEVKAFFKNFKWVEAAGGIVKHTETQQLLFIYRKEKWDLPKGKIEKFETPEEAAIREVQEECGLEELKIIAPLSPTFHVYFAYGKHWIKKTHWFQMHTSQLGTNPQLEENITEAKWFDPTQLSEIQQNTYALILDIIDESKNSSVSW